MPVRSCPATASIQQVWIPPWFIISFHIGSWFSLYAMIYCFMVSIERDAEKRFFFRKHSSIRLENSNARNGVNRFYWVEPDSLVRHVPYCFFFQTESTCWAVSSALTVNDGERPIEFRWKDSASATDDRKRWGLNPIGTVLGQPTGTPARDRWADEGACEDLRIARHNRRLSLRRASRR